LYYLADLHISPLTVEALREEGYNISRVTDLLPATASDQEILAVARRLGSALITADLDFSAMIALTAVAGPSLISLRLAHPTPDRVTRILLESLPLIEKNLEQGAIVSIDETTFRVRPLPIS